jgi:hypothetical protein
MSVYEPHMVTTTMELSTRRAFGNLTGGKLTLASRLAARVLVEGVGKTLPTARGDESDDDFNLRIVASFLPLPWSLGSIVPAAVRRVIDESVMAADPARCSSPSDGTGGWSLRPDGTTRVVVETMSADERELKEKTMTIHGWTFYKNSQSPWTLFYPAHWTAVQVTGAPQSSTPARTADRAFTAWFVLWDSFTRGLTLAEHFQHRMIGLQRTMESWFELTETTTTDQLTGPLLKLWFATVDGLGELYLLMKGLTLKASPSAATACYVAHLVSKRHAGKPTDYFAALTEARQKAETTGSKNLLNPSFRQ